MAKTLDFYFDFSSPYGFLAATQVEALAARHDCDLVWRPYLLGAAFKTTGRQPLLNHPVVGDYARHDIARTARLLDIAWQMPDKFPIMTVAACRAYYWLKDIDVQQAVEFCKLTYQAYFAENRNITDKAVLAEIVASLGIDPEQLLEALGDATVKQYFRDQVERALDLGVFGSPYIIVDGEPFWGLDHFDQLEIWLERGGW